MRNASTYERSASKGSTWTQSPINHFEAYASGTTHACCSSEATVCDQNRCSCAAAVTNNSHVAHGQWIGLIDDTCVCDSQYWGTKCQSGPAAYASINLTSQAAPNTSHIFGSGESLGGAPLHHRGCLQRRWLHYLGGPDRYDLAQVRRLQAPADKWVLPANHIIAVDRALAHTAQVAEAISAAESALIPTPPTRPPRTPASAQAPTQPPLQVLSQSSMSCSRTQSLSSSAAAEALQQSPLWPQIRASLAFEPASSRGRCCRRSPTAMCRRRPRQRRRPIAARLAALICCPNCGAAPAPTRCRPHGSSAVSRGAARQLRR